VSALAIFQQRWTAAAISVPFFETVNLQVDLNTMPDQWASAIAEESDRADVTLGGSKVQVEEAGAFHIGLFARSGTGAAVLDPAIAEIKAAFHGWRGNGLLISRVTGPLDIDPHAEGEWWRVAMLGAYSYWTTRDATPAGFGDWVGFPGAP
jgi:hypothetical protein